VRGVGGVLDHDDGLAALERAGLGEDAPEDREPLLDGVGLQLEVEQGDGHGGPRV
jgi:hypothetical protein